MNQFSLTGDPLPKRIILPFRNKTQEDVLAVSTFLLAVSMAIEHGDVNHDASTKSATQGNLSFFYY